MRVESALPSVLTSLQSGMSEELRSEIHQASDAAFGGGILLLIIMWHAFWIRLVTGTFLKRVESIQARAALWHADLLFTAMVAALLFLHMSEVMWWSVALLVGGLVHGLSMSTYFAANCYTALGEPFKLADEWRLVPPIIAMSGIFTFAWTASVLVNFVARYNDLRAGILIDRRARKANLKH
jgi:hypothetical protein